MECPQCSAPAAHMVVTRAMIAKPLGSFSLAGTQPKVSVLDCLRLTCGECSWAVHGQIHNGYFVPFATKKEEED